MMFRAVYNKAVFDIEAPTARMAKRIIKKTYGFVIEVLPLNLFRYSKKHLASARIHEKGMYGRA